MTLLLVGDEYCYFYGGKHYISETGFIQIRRYLAAFDSVVVAFRTKAVASEKGLGKYKFLAPEDKVRHIDVPFFQGPKQFAKCYFKVMKALKNGIYGCDMAMLRLPSTLAFAALKVIKKRKIPYATEVVFDCYDAVMSSKSLFIKAIWKKQHKMQVKACNNAIGVACVTEKYLQRHYFSKLPNAVTSHYSSIELTPDFFLSPRKFPDKEVVRLIHVANQVNFASRKGHNQLIEVISLLNKEHKRAEIVFIGEDYNDGIAKLTAYAESLGVADAVHFTGYLTKSELRKQLEEADIAVLPTRAEGLPRVVIEAMALGLPCITSPVSGNPELINQEFLIGYDDVEGMAKACTKLVTDKKLYESESKVNFERSKQYSTEVLNPRRTKFFKDLIANC